MNEPLRTDNYKISSMPLQRAHRQVKQDKLLRFLGDTLLIVAFIGGCFAVYALLAWITGW